MKKNKKLIPVLLGLMTLSACSMKNDVSSSNALSNTLSNSETITGQNSESQTNTSQVNSTTSQGTSLSENTNISSNSSVATSNNSSSNNIKIDGKINVTKVGVGYETAYCEWQEVQNATSYNVYYKLKSENTYHKIDDMLIRKYASFMRADIVGLKAGEYDFKVVACSNDSETDVQSTFSAEVIAHIREGYGFVNGSASGAYNDDGTLKSNAKVVYVTSANAKTVTATIGGTECKGFQKILDAQKNCTTPLNIRVVGTINDSDVESARVLSDDNAIQLEGSKSFSEMNVTIEGIGNDAVFKGFGIFIKNCKNVEVRNLGFLNFKEDGVSINKDSSNLWIHNNDFFYGQDGGSDKVKGDGALDTKLSTNITHSFNHFWDSGKCNLQGMKEESEDNCITYHHNWFDHSDSRHPRVRTCTVHVYNNYYDGNAKYGIGATMGASIFSEANYFRNCKYPMLISQQGSDVATNSKGTFSSETGGIIKSYNNYMVGQKRFVSYQNDNTNFDAYVASSRDEKVPTSVKALSGSATYSNFDTESTMYKYNVETPEEAKNTVTKYAGRIEGGDLKWTFSLAEDTNYDVIPELREAVTNYQSSLISIQGSSSQSSGGNDTPTPTPTPTPPTIDGAIEHNFTTSGKESDTFVINGNLSTGKGTVTYNGLELTQCLKMESLTSITFTISKSMTLILVFNSDFNGNVKIDNTKHLVTNGILEISLESGEHTITKGDSASLFYIILK